MIRYLYIVPGDGTGKPLPGYPAVDVVEYDDGQTMSQAVADVAAALGLSDAEARKLVARKNPGAEKTSEEGARELAAAICARSVEGRERNTYGGHPGELVATDVKPTPAQAAHVGILPPDGWQYGGRSEVWLGPDGNGPDADHDDDTTREGK